AVAKRPGQLLAVDALQSAEASIEIGGEARAGTLHPLVRPEPASREHRREGEGYEERKEAGRRDRQTELPEVHPHDTGHRGHWHVDHDVQEAVHRIRE